jgi:hypothetical protein
MLPPPDALPVAINLANPVQGDGVALAEAIDHLKGEMVLRVERDIGKRNDDEPLLQPVIVADGKRPLTELRVPADAIKQLADRDQGETPAASRQRRHLNSLSR